MTTAEEYKAQGNDSFRAKDFSKAIELFTKAIDVSDKPNHVLYSNRSACYTSMGEYEKALKDAQQCVEINPTWAKGHNRVAAALYGEGKLDDAQKAYEEALKLDPANKMAQAGLQDITNARSSQNAGPGARLGKIFSDPFLIEKLKANPKTSEYMKDPTLVEKVKKMQGNPSSMSQDLFSDPRLMTVVATILGIDLNVPPPTAEEVKKEEAKSNVPSEPETQESKPEPKAQPKAEEPKKEESSVPKEKQEADGYKAEGNKLYKEHKFEDAIKKYNKAWETYKDVTYLNNRAAAEFEMEDYDTAIATCNTAITEGREMHANYTVIAKSFARIGNCYVKEDKLEKAIDAYESSLTEHRTASTLTKLRNTERELKQRQEKAYIDKDKATEAHTRGNEHFKKGEWPEAIKEYTEMIKRDPSDPKGYSNRAAALSKLMSYPDAIRDSAEAIKRDPNFVRAYIRKANAEMAMKQYKDADDTLEAARQVLKKTNQLNSPMMGEIQNLSQRTLSKRFGPQPGETYEQTMKRVQKDPEVVEILADPVMQTILQQAQNNPAALQEHMKNPEVYRKVMVLMAAGIIRTR